jgi:hypothetical protein
LVHRRSCVTPLLERRRAPFTLHQQPVLFRERVV